MAGCFTKISRSVRVLKSIENQQPGVVIASEEMRVSKKIQKKYLKIIDNASDNKYTILVCTRMHSFCVKTSSELQKYVKVPQETFILFTKKEVKQNADI